MVMFLKFVFGCCCLILGFGYFEVFKKDNVEFISMLIDEIINNGINFIFGEKIEFDVIVCVIGYDVEVLFQFKVIGCNGIILVDRWKLQIEIYLVFVVDQFFNFFMIGGFGSGLGLGSLVSVFEVQGDYVVKVI